MQPSEINVATAGELIEQPQYPVHFDPLSDCQISKRFVAGEETPFP